MLRKLNNNGKPAERVTPLKCTTNPRVTTISGQKKALDILGDLYAGADPFLFGRIILLIKNALKAGL